MAVNNYYNSNREEMRMFLPNKINRSVEFGCGVGNFSGYIKKQFQAETWGVDLSLDALNESKNNLSKIVHSDAFASLDHLPDNYFDCVICNDFLEHIASPEKFIELLKLKVTKDSCLVASIPNVRFWTNSKNFLIKKDWQYTNDGILDNTHLRFFTQKSIIHFIKDNNLELEVIKGLNELKSFRIEFLNLLTFGSISDMKYLQYGIRARFL